MKKSIPIGLMFILLAVYVILSEIGYVPDIPIGRLLVTTACLIVVFEGLRKRWFMQVMLALWLIFVVLKVYITDFVPESANISSWTALLVAALLGIGLNLMFKGKSGMVEFSWTHRNRSDMGVDYEREEDLSGPEISIDNSFSESSKYINSNCFKEGKFENAFGNLNIYLDNCVMDPNGALIDIENAFGNMNLYLPGGCKINITDKNFMGGVDIIGKEAEDPGGVTVDIKGDVAFGKVNIYL